MTEKSRPDTILVVAGEASADLHAASLVRELKRLRPGLMVYGLGGKALAKEGAQLLFDFSSTGVVGVAEVLPELKNFLKAYRALINSLEEKNPRAALLLDLPDFNLFLAKKLKQKRPDIKIIYYISPQVWAWRPGRVKTIAKRADAMLVLFPFEKEIYERAGMDVEFVGHPLLDQARPSRLPQELREEFGLKDKTAVALLPGSRKAEIARYLPLMRDAALRLLGGRPGLCFLLALAPTVEEEMVKSLLGPLQDAVKIVRNRTYDVLAVCEAAVIASGTAALEAALMETPMVVLGAVSWLTYFLVKPFTLVEHYSLPNIIAGKRIVPELIQREANPERIKKELAAILDCPEKSATIKEELRKVKKALGTANASRRAAQAFFRRVWPEEENTKAR